ncbi:MAG TPA: beta-ketoacyl synthase chain length factor [Aromatoleum sp.]|uniref:beta-ketoacyl synthase chain length factor n=1 Tax=Aromatoleum sp. TaxID=2307007 RepID=UPI002B498CC1|nr:beta-ketoacyl synthase chain length factor [Aromatoleum sp.]HJV27471.1 beta-ketoacyl synthase chain length factor [Aromatoleum sp.]
MTVSLSAWIHGIGVLGPGLPDWPTTAAVLRRQQSWTFAPTVLTAPELLPPAERRRAVKVVKLALSVGLQAAAAAGADASTLTTIFTSSGGDGLNCHQICETLASDDRQISPTRFHNSVHNAAAGYWSIATGATAPSAVLCAYDGSFGAGLLEALAQVTVDDVPCLLIAYDADYPEPLRATRPIPDAFGVAMLLAPTPGEQPIGRLSVALTTDAAVTLPDSELESLRKAIPAARSLPLLAAIANGTLGRIVLDYLDHAQMAVEFST